LAQHALKSRPAVCWAQEIAAASTGSVESALTGSVLFESGAQLDLGLTWSGPGRRTRYLFVGDHGQLEAADSNLSLRIAHRRRPCVWHSDDGLSDSPVHTKWFMGVLDGFADALAGDGAVSDAFVSSFYCMQAIWALYRSVAEGASQVVESA